jgi:hypothetical protein
MRHKSYIYVFNAMILNIAYNPSGPNNWLEWNEQSEAHARSALYDRETGCNVTS